MEAPITATPNGPYAPPPPKRNDAYVRRGLQHSTKKCHYHCRRLTPHLHREDCQICLLNDRKSTYTKEEGDSTTTKPVTTATTNHRI
jgi:hypothetical protein